jgi:hypothetical protein
MRIAAAVACSAALLLAACGSSSESTSSTTTATSSTPAASSTSVGATTTTPELPTTSLPCQPIPFPTTPVKSPATTTASLLTNAKELGDNCVDHVVFDFVPKGTGLPGYTITYANGPFTGDGSGAPIDVPGNAFISVRIAPGYGYDFVNGKPTYVGSKSVRVSNANHVQSIVETGDFEGVLNWVIGLDTKRPFSVQATATPRRQLVVTVS